MPRRFLTRHAAVVASVVLAGSILAAGCGDPAARKSAHFEQGNRLFDQHSYREAIIEYRRALRIDPLYGEARYRLAEAYERSDNAELALAEYVSASEALPNDVRAQLSAGRHLLLGGRFEEAQQRAQRILALDKDHAEARILHGNALAGLNDLEGAVADIEEAIRLDPTRGRSYAQLALVHLADGRRREAEGAFLKAVEVDPGSITAHLSLANYQWATGSTADAERTLVRAFALDPGHLITNRMMAAFYIGNGRLPEAERHLRALADAKSIAALITLSDYYILLGRIDDARVALERLRSNRTTAAGAQARLAALEYTAGQTRIAHSLLDSLIEQLPNDAFARLLKARWLMTEGAYEEALEHARRAVAATPRNVTGYYLLGLLQVATGRTDEAIASFTQVTRLNPRATAAQVQLSRLHLGRGAADSAVSLATEALSSSPRDLDARLALVRGYLARGDDALGAAALDELARDAPDAPVVHVLLGQRRLLAKDLHGARRAYQRALDLSAGSEDALKGLTTVDVLQGRRADARMRLQKYLAERPSDTALLLLRAKVELADKDWPRMKQTLRQVLALDFNAVEAYQLLVRGYAAHESLAAGIAEARTLWEREPNNVGAHLMLAILEQVQGDLRQARQRYRAILDRSPSAAVAANNLAWIYLQEGSSLDAPLDLAETARQLLPVSSDVAHTMGVIQYRIGAGGRAVELLEYSASEEPDNAVYKLHLGMAYAQSRDLVAARRTLEAALKLDPTMDEAKEALEALPRR